MQNVICIVAVDYLTILHYHDPVAEVFNCRQIVRNEDYRDLEFEA